MWGKCSQVLPDIHCSLARKHCCSSRAYIKHHRGHSRVIYEVLKFGSYSPPDDTSPMIQVYWLKRSFLDPHKLSHLMLPVKCCMCFLNCRVLFFLPCVRLFKIRWHRHDLSSGLGGCLGLSIQDNIPPFTICSVPQSLRQQICTVPGSWEMGWDVVVLCHRQQELHCEKKPPCLPQAAALHITNAACAWAGISAVWSQECSWMPAVACGLSLRPHSLALLLCKRSPSVQPADSMPLLSSC